VENVQLTHDFLTEKAQARLIITMGASISCPAISAFS